MTFCPYCGKKLTEIKDFCPYCSKELKQKDDKKPKDKPKSEKVIKHHIALSVLLIVVFTGLIILIITSLKQRSSVGTGENLLLTLPEEKVVDISQQIKQIKAFEEKRKEGYKLNEKPFDEGNYAYDERAVDFRLVCTNPCPVSKQVLEQEFAAIAYSLSTLRGLTKSNIEEEIMPFEVHASEDSRCSMLKTALAYKTTFVDANGHYRGLLCFFYDKLQYDRSKFPYSTSVHEVTHLFEDGKMTHNSILFEGLSEMMESFFVKGNEKNSFCWQGNNWYGQTVNNPHDPHGTGRQLFFELCNRYGFDYNDLPELFRQLDNAGGNVNEIGFVKIMNNIVGSDTTALFKEAGVI